MSFSSNNEKMKKFTMGFQPHNPFNYFIEGSSLYLESGMLDWGKAGFANFESYFPGEWYFSKSFTPILGNIFVNKTSNNNVRVDSVDFDGSHSSPIESWALGCREKSKTVVMINPTGGLQGLVQSSQIQIEEFFFPNIDGGMNTNDTSYSDSGLLSTRTLTSDSIPTGPYGIGGEFAQEVTFNSPVFCSNSLIFRKWCHSVRPPSLFTGKLRLLVQSFYGSNLHRYSLDIETGASIFGIESRIPEGVDPQTIPEEDKKDRIFALNYGYFGTSILITANNHRYFLAEVGSNGLRINYLKPDSSVSGDFLQSFLNGNAENLTVSQKELDNYEAYLLSTLLPTRWVNVSDSGSLLSPYNHGEPIYFGWKATWDGKKISVITRKQIENSVWQTKVWTADIIIGSIENVFQDWENGFYGEQDEKDPYNTAFYNALQSQFTVNTSLLETTEYQLGFNVLDIQYNKIWIWDELKGKYKWDIPYDPFWYPLERYPKNPNAALYCWYDKEDNLRIVRYRASELVGELNFSQPLLSVCGPGTNKSCSIIRNNRTTAGFSINMGVQQISIGLDKFNSTFSANNEKATIGGGEFPEDWSLFNIGVCDSSLPPKSAQCLDQALPFSEAGSQNWSKIATGEGPCEKLSGSGQEFNLNSLIIPQNNCESVLLGRSTNFYMTGIFRKGTCSANTRAQVAWYCSFSRYGCNVFKSASETPIVFDPPCNQEKFGDLSDKIVYGPSRDSGGGGHSDDCIYRIKQPCGVEASSQVQGNLSWKETTFSDIEYEANSMNGNSLLFYCVGKSSGFEILRVSGNDSMNVNENCEGSIVITGDADSFAEFSKDVEEWNRWFTFLDLANPYTSAYTDFRESALGYLNYGIGGYGYFTNTYDKTFFDSSLQFPYGLSFVGAI